MNITCTPAWIVDSEYPKQGMCDMVNAEFQNVLLDFSVFYPLGKFYDARKLNISTEIRHDKISLGLIDKIKQLLETVEFYHIHMNVARVPFLDRKCTEQQEIEKDYVQECVKAASITGVHYIIIPPIFTGTEQKIEWEKNKEYYLHLAEFVRKTNIMILLENQCRDIHGHLVRGICSNEQKAAEWVDRLNQLVGEERFGFCMNVGNCNLCAQNMYDFVKILGKRIKAVILSDCDGNKPLSMLPFTAVNRNGSQTDWLNLIRGLREMSFDGELIMDIADTAAAFSPILRPQLLHLTKAIADYFQWQIEIETLLNKYPKRVLFGAGNMCRNYMKCYGKKYPPLFTCDNNKSLWETEFCGITVKNPENLKKLPINCAIFICNIYYREIKAQLRNMDIKNPIEIFNDEYMSTFYIDRLGEK